MDDTLSTTPTPLPFVGFLTPPVAVSSPALITSIAVPGSPRHRPRRLLMLCPMCKKELADDTATCPRCRADLSLLVGHQTFLKEGLSRADEWTRKGDLAEAVWAYLEVLEAEPFEPTARRQVGRVAAAVRHFDRLSALRYGGPRGAGGWLGLLVVLVAGLGLLLGGFVVGVEVGRRAPTPPPPNRPAEQNPEPEVIPAPREEPDEPTRSPPTSSRP